MCVACRREKLSQYSGDLDEIQKRVAKYRGDRLKYSYANQIAMDREVLMEALLLKQGKCPSCELGIPPHRNCVMR